MNNIDEILLEIEREEKHIFEQLIQIAKIPSPTGQENNKIRYIQKIIQQLGYNNVQIDRIGNCIVQLQNPAFSKSSKKILFVAHVDTACQVDSKEISIKQDKKYIYGHGVCDNSAGVIGLLTFLRIIKKFELDLPNSIMVAFTVGEEGLGGKRGMKGIINRFGRLIKAVVNVESHNIGRLTHRSIGQYRAQLSVETGGGHSFRDFGQPNSIVILSRIITDISEKRLPQRNGKTTFNVGKISGGEGVNLIARWSSALLEIRSEDENYFKKAKKLLSDVIEYYKNIYPDIKIENKIYVDKKPAFISSKHPLCTIVKEVQKSLNITPRYDSANNDGDISLAVNIPTVTIGASIDCNTHSLSEYMEKNSFCLGLKQVFAVLYSVASSYKL